MVALSIAVAGSIGNYSDLVAKVAAWMDRDDLAANIPDFIALAEARFNRELRTLNQETQLSFTTASGSYALPSGFRRLKRLKIVSTPDQQLVQIAAAAAPERFSGVTGSPQAYYIENRTLYFLPPPSGDTTFSGAYVQRIDPLSVTTVSNWLLEEHPDVYLMATLLEAAVYLHDDDAVGYLDQRVASTINSINIASRRDAWAVGPLAPQGPSQVRGGKC